MRTGKMALPIQPLTSFGIPQIVTAIENDPLWIAQVQRKVVRTNQHAKSSPENERPIMSRNSAENSRCR